MKLAKLSLAAIVVAGLATSSFAADTLADAFKNGKVKGTIQGYYWTRDSGTKDADIFTSGLDLTYVTDSFNGLTFGATFQATSSPFADADGKAIFNRDMYGSGAQLSEAYIAYTMGKTTAKVGRQYISTPLVSGSGSRVTKQSYEAAVLINTDLPNTTLVAGYVDKYQDRTDGKGGIAQFDKFNEDGAYTFAVINKSIPNTTIRAQYAQLVDVSDHYYIDAAYAGKSDSFTYGLAAQYFMLEKDDPAFKDTNAIAIKASMGMGAISGWVAYSTVSDDSDIGIFGLGSGTDILFTNNIIGDMDAYSKNTDSYAANLEYAINKSAKIGTQYLHTDNGAATNDTAYTLDFYANYKFDGALKGLGLELIYEDGEKNNGVGTSELRINANYNF